MIISSEVVLKQLAILGIRDNQLSGSQLISPIGQETEYKLVPFFFKPFNSDERFHFVNHTNNPVFNFSSDIFNDAQNTLAISEQLANHFLSDFDGQMNDCELLVAFFEDCVLDDEVTDVIGIFLLDNKETFLNINEENGSFDLRFQKGLSPNKLDKGILIFNTDVENGYQTLVLDKTKTSDWKEKFLNAEKIKDNYFQTQVLINDIQEFAQQTYQASENKDKIALINESIDYIKGNDFFDQADYQEQVLQSPELIDRFENFQEEKSEEGHEKAQHFEISKPAIKKAKRFVRSVIKLDKNFHVYVHGNKEHIIKGYDAAKNKHYYTLYFDEEK